MCTITYHIACLPTSWPVFQNDNSSPNNTCSVWPHVITYVSLGTAKLNDIDPLSICWDSKNSVTSRRITPVMAMPTHAKAEYELSNSVALWQLSSLSSWYNSLGDPWDGSGEGCNIEQVSQTPGHEEWIQAAILELPMGYTNKSCRAVNCLFAILHTSSYTSIILAFPFTSGNWGGNDIPRYTL